MLPSQWRAWRNAWASDLLAEVEEVFPGTYLVPSVSAEGRAYVVDYVPFPAGIGFVYLCTCDAGVLGAVACRHAAAVHGWRLERRWGFRLKNPFCEKGDGRCRDHRAPRTSTR
jgi:hypothetical protein